MLLVPEELVKTNSYLYGPVISRRLGISLGVDVIPFKVCSFDCIYCQLGHTTGKTVKRGSFYLPNLILKEIKDTLKSGTTMDYVSFSGSGEPTLNADLGKLIRRIKKMTETPVAVITNGSLLWDGQVQEELLAADVVLPSLDAGTEATFQRVNRPHSFLNLERIVGGLVDFRARYKGQIRLEVMLLEGINSGPEELERIRELLPRIEPDGIDLNTAMRPPAESFARALTSKKMEQIRAYFGARTGVITQPPLVHGERRSEKLREAIFQTLERRPCTIEELSTALGRHRHEVAKLIGSLLEEGLISQKSHGQQNYFFVGEK
jgi:wyosine [tRNA(Phe)-imidazoG37] synthetase (radical SAM superfamily)